MSRFDQQTKNPEAHAIYLEFCALLSTGELSQTEVEEFEPHLAGCAECQRLVADYAGLISKGFPLLVAGDHVPEVEGFDRELQRAREGVFAKIEAGSRQASDRALGSFYPPTTEKAAFSFGFPVFRWALITLLSVSMGAAGYLLGVRQQHAPIAAEIESDRSLVGLRAELGSLTQERNLLDADINQRSETINRLNAKIAHQMEEMSSLKKLVAETQVDKAREASTISQLQGENLALHADGDISAQRLQEALKSLAELRQQVRSLESLRTADLLESASMQRKVDELTAQINLHDATVAEQQRLLASDRDIRELMGARDLYIADVFDVDRDGQTRKPFGRVFYTKNKSLIFYAYDLDKAASLRTAKIFQAWGTNSSDKGRPVSMGILYMDNEANRRWVLKFDNPKVLEKIDSVFVTVEPKGGSELPSGKQLLYAFLRTNPNHP